MQTQHAIYQTLIQCRDDQKAMDAAVVKYKKIIEQCDDNGREIIHLAAMHGYANILESLIFNGANVNKFDNNRCTPMHYAARGGYVRCIQLLIVNGADINVVDVDGDTPLHVAANYRCAAAVEYLVSVPQIDTKIKNERGLTPLGAIRGRAVIGFAPGNTAADDERRIINALQ
jgi:ankyrin repeat protein